MARSTRYSCLARPDLLLTEYRFHIQYKQKRASGNKSKIFITIKRSIQTLWLLRTITLAWCDQTSSSPSINSTSTIWKRVSRNSCKILITIQRSNQKLWPVRPVVLACATRPPPHRLSIPHPLYGKGHLETHVKF